MKLYEVNSFFELDIDKLVKAEWNYKEENEALAEKLISNIKRNGQIENIIVRELETGFFEVVNGNHRYDAMKAIEAKKVFVYNLGKISDMKARRIAIETNETKFISDQVKLAGLIADMSKEFERDDLLSTMPYDAEQLDNYIKMSTFDWNNYKGDNSSGEAGAVKRDDVVHFTLSADALLLWNDLRFKMKEDKPDISDYDIFVHCIRTVLDAD